MELKLKINGIRFHLLEDENIDKLKNIKAKKLNYLWKLLLSKRLQRQRIYFVKNCEIKMFNPLNKYEYGINDGFAKKVMNEFHFIPNIEKNKFIKEQWGTSVFFHYQNNNLNEITLQCIYNQRMANFFIYDFEEKMEKRYGKGNCSKNSDTRFCMWSSEYSVVYTELSSKKKHSYIHWISQRI